MLASTVTSWLRRPLGASPADAEAAYRILCALGAVQALFSDEQVSPGQLSTDDLADALTRAFSAVVRR